MTVLFVLGYIAGVLVMVPGLKILARRTYLQLFWVRPQHMAGAPVTFWRPHEKNGWLSNWSPHAVEEGGVVFATTEHYYMYHKALAFGDARAAAAVLAAATPREAKAAGRGVRGFDPAVWERSRERVMLRALELKVEQHPQLLARLLETAGSAIAEASPFDSVWGRGKDGRGANLLGKLWVRVREERL